MQAVRSVRVIAGISGTRLCEFFTPMPDKQQDSFCCNAAIMACQKAGLLSVLCSHGDDMRWQLQLHLHSMTLCPSGTSMAKRTDKHSIWCPSRFAEQDAWMKWVSQPHEGFAPAIPTEAHCIRNLEQLLALSVFFCSSIALEDFISYAFSNACSRCRWANGQTFQPIVARSRCCSWTSSVLSLIKKLTLATWQKTSVILRVQSWVRCHWPQQCCSTLGQQPALTKRWVFFCLRLWCKIALTWVLVNIVSSKGPDFRLTPKTGVAGSIKPFWSIQLLQ